MDHSIEHRKFGGNTTIIKKIMFSKRAEQQSGSWIANNQLGKLN